MVNPSNPLHYYTYYKAYLIKVIYIFIKDTMLSFYILYEDKPASNNLRIFVEGSLVVVLSIEFNLEL